MFLRLFVLVLQGLVYHLSGCLLVTPFIQHNKSKGNKTQQTKTKAKVDTKSGETLYT